jgi:hypothetical protein
MREFPAGEKSDGAAVAERKESENGPLPSAQGTLFDRTKLGCDVNKGLSEKRS